MVGIPGHFKAGSRVSFKAPSAGRKAQRERLALGTRNDQVRWPKAA